MRTLAVAILGLSVTVMCRGVDLAQEIRALRPRDTSAGEKAVLDNLQERARLSLASLKHPRTRQEADHSRGALRQQLQRSLGHGLLQWPPNLQAPRSVPSTVTAIALTRSSSRPCLAFWYPRTCTCRMV